MTVRKVMRPSALREGLPVPPGPCARARVAPLPLEHTTHTLTKPSQSVPLSRRRSTMPANLSTLLESTEPTLLTTGWRRTESPLWHAGGYVTFVDLAGSRLLRWDPTGQVTVVREQTGEGNGCTLDRQGR